MPDILNEALGLAPASHAQESSIIEIEFPDGAVSRYPVDAAGNLATQGRIQYDWRARTPGSECWTTVKAALEDPLPKETDPSGLVAEGGLRNGSPPNSENGPILASIGQKSLTGLLKGEGFASTWLVLTPFRIYGNGRTLTSGTSSRTRMVADISKLSSISMEYRSRWILFVGGLLLTGITLLLLLSVRSSVLCLILAPLFLIGSAMLVVYFLTRRRFLVLNLSGYSYSFSMSGVPEDVVLAFVESVITVLGQKTRPGQLTESSR